MPIRNRSINTPINISNYPHLISKYNQSNDNNFSHKSNEPTNFNLKSISLEDCDKAIYKELNERFKIDNLQIPIILLDGELTSLQEQNYKQYDNEKQYLNGPYFTMFRKDSKPKYKNNPSNKQIVYTEVIKKPNGIVYLDYITSGSMWYDLIYDFKFISNFREKTNLFEQQMRSFFRNKRNILIVQNERFSFGPADFNTFSTLNITNLEDSKEKSIYVTTYEIKLECFIRNLDDMQKRERTNKFTIDFNINDGENIFVDNIELNTKTFPENNTP